MGDLNVKNIQSQQEMQHFVKCLLKDVHALEHMLAEDWFESDIIRIGAEQEICLVDENFKPAYRNLEALEIINDPGFTTELARFNLETNLVPLEFKGKAISQLHQNLKDTLEKAMAKIAPLGLNLAFTGILPSIRKSDVGIEQITPVARYHALMNGLKAMRGEFFELRLSGLDEINIKQETAMLEACNTSFQVHLQVAPHDFVRKYNIAQALAGPVMSVAVNSPMLFGRRLWQETRIALFQQSLDIRTFNEHLRERSPRVTFGNDWLKKSIVEIYQEDIARFKVILATDIDEDVFEKIRNGETPKLRALNIHNSTVYRWNRPCYGISDNGKPHLRIENRILPSGPSLPDEIANATFWLGLMNGMEDEYPDVTQHMSFDDAKNNFFAAARFGLDTQFTWFNGKKISPTQLILEQLLPIARNGLDKAGIVAEDRDYYLGIIEERVKTGQTGAQWILKSFSSLAQQGTPRDEIATTITAAIVKHQGALLKSEGKDQPQYDPGIPIHKWELASLEDMDYEPSELRVEEIMNTDLITVHEDDILDLVANLMDWRKIRHVMVEDNKGNLVGLVSSRVVLRYFNKRHMTSSTEPLAQVKDIMVKKPITVSPQDNIMKVMELMRKNMISCLPVADGKELVGVITESDFVHITGNLLMRKSRKKRKGKG